MIAPRPPAPRPALRTWRVALGLHVAIVGAISLAAYLGALPHWPWLATWDWLLHALLVGPIAMLLDGALAWRELARLVIPARARLALPLGPTLVFCAAAAEEYLQRFSHRRSSTWHDFAGNTAGILLFTALGRLLARRADAAASPTVDRYTSSPR